MANKQEVLSNKNISGTHNTANNPASRDRPKRTFLMAESYVQPLVTVFIGSVLSAFIGRLAYEKGKRDKDRKDEQITQRAIDDAIHERIRKLELDRERAIPLTELFQHYLIKELDRIQTPQISELLNSTNSLTETDRRLLSALIRQRVFSGKEELTRTERDAASILPIIMEMQLRDRDRPTEPQVRCVTVPLLDKGKETH